VHLENHDVTYVAVARAPIEEIEVVRKRMGWRFRWVSSYNSDFNYDFNVSFRPEEVAAGRAYYDYRYADPGLEDLSGHTVFFKDDSGEIYRTYSTYGRGDEEFLGAYRFLDVTPKGRKENGPYHSLADWVRLRNMYGKGGIVEGNGRYHAPSCACSHPHTYNAGERAILYYTPPHFLSRYRRFQVVVGDLNTSQVLSYSQHSIKYIISNISCKCRIYPAPITSNS
jgi:hypothetical protein